MYSFESKVRYSELNEERIVRPEAIVNYLQDCTTFHSDSLGADVDFYKNEKKVWVLNSWQIEIKRQMNAGEEITVCTWPYDFTGAYGHRNFIIRDSAGCDIVQANTLWVFTDMITGRPVKLPDNIAKFYTLEEKLDMNYMDRKVKVPEGVQGIPKEQVPVRKYFIDSNGHVNNGKYIACAEEYIPDGFKVERIRAEYKRAAKYGDTFYPVVYRQDDENGKTHIWVALNDEGDKTYAMVQFDIYK
ncbi:MAG: acyl-[Lachnospiraceae bacterium]|nr:acyl-[acyl-carrier-protein] thioesterase [Lachnospiraceae bacterium]